MINKSDPELSIWFMKLLVTFGTGMARQECILLTGCLKGY
jgi:hypothetical protein